MYLMTVFCNSAKDPVEDHFHGSMIESRRSRENSSKLHNLENSPIPLNMQTRYIESNLRWTLLVVLVSSMGVFGNPRPNIVSPIDGVTLLDPAKVICIEETTNLCQQCAKKTKSAVVYPWCCANHEGVREWCQHYLHFGLP